MKKQTRITLTASQRYAAIHWLDEHREDCIELSSPKLAAKASEELGFPVGASFCAGYLKFHPSADQIRAARIDRKREALVLAREAMKKKRKREREAKRTPLPELKTIADPILDSLDALANWNPRIRAKTEILRTAFRQLQADARLEIQQIEQDSEDLFPDSTGC